MSECNNNVVSVVCSYRSDEFLENALNFMLTIYG